MNHNVNETGLKNKKFKGSNHVKILERSVPKLKSQSKQTNYVNILENIFQYKMLNSKD